MPIVAIAKLFAKPGQRDDIIERLKPEAEYVKNEELTTSAYYFFKPEEEENSLLGLEIYESMENIETVHMQSAPFKTMVDSATPVSEKPFELEFFEPADVGFLTRPGFSTLQAPDVFLLQVYFVVKPGTREKVLSYMNEIAKDVWEKEDGCFSYYYAKSIDNPDKFMIFERYVDRPALEVTHRTGAKFLEMFKRLDDEDLVVSKFIYNCYESGVGFLARD
ncbi:hypothetical protein POJ06DRAFT_117179 [Lipomyces tetrasporus]|uniref:ABM domain-containing protein n=1 Tax=Lipomyces tetrasporus TaxID=54092 RepID=A0AAD7VRA9_9ASCO|nr:uncharacterized protein POJ06DRAFT_117179 [Lipomyces tetrasporus]KAJ8099817.1 hypothetical protein POJ06DRAFT_117179 [Lipomyces tetrasporus]